MAFKEGCSLPVVCSHCFTCVLTPIKFNDYFLFDASEIYDVAFNPVLSSELETIQLPVAQVPP